MASGINDRSIAGPARQVCPAIRAKTSAAVEKHHQAPGQSMERPASQKYVRKG